MNEPELQFVDAEGDWLPYSARVLRTKNGKLIFVVGSLDSADVLVQIKLRDVAGFEPDLSEVEVLWANNGPKCGLIVRGTTYVVVTLDGDTPSIALVADQKSDQAGSVALVRDLPLPKDERSKFCHARASIGRRRFGRSGRIQRH